MVTLPPTAPSSSSAGAEASTERMADKENEKEKQPEKRDSGGSASASPDKREMKESWRKSDSTNSHHTVRQNSSRTSRPVSWAESFHSAYTIVPSNGVAGEPQLPTNKRLSALVTDAHFGMPEEEAEEEDVDVDGDHADVGSVPPVSLAVPNFGSNEAEPQARVPPPLPHKSSKDSLRKANRRSISLSSALPSTVVNFLVGSGHGKPPQPTSISSAASASAAEVRKVSHSISGFESLNVSTTQLAPQNHLRQQSEVLHPLSPLRPSGTSYPNYHAPSMSISPSQLSSPSPSSPSYTSLPSPQAQQPSTTSSIKGKIHAFLPKAEQKLPAVPGSPAGTPDSYGMPPAPAIPSNASVNRQPTLSGLGPSAAGLAKRAVERMGKRWGWGDMMGGLSSSSNSSNTGVSSGHSSAASVSTSMTSVSNSPPPWVDGGSVKSGFGMGSPYVPGPYGLAKTGSRGSNPATPASVYGHAHHHSVVHTFLPGPSKSGGHKRTPNARSLGATTVMGDAVLNGASSSTLASTSASTSTSESDPFSPSGPMLGRLLRGPLRNGKVVFGKELKTVVKETRVAIQEENPDGSRKEGLIKELEERVLPSLVVRCAQHLLIWGVQEEGLFR